MADSRMAGNKIKEEEEKRQRRSQDLKMRKDKNAVNTKKKGGVTTQGTGGGESGQPEVSDSQYENYAKNAIRHDGSEKGFIEKHYNENVDKNKHPTLASYAKAHYADNSFRTRGDGDGEMGYDFKIAHDNNVNPRMAGDALNNNTTKPTAAPPVKPGGTKPSPATGPVRENNKPGPGPDENQNSEYADGYGEFLNLPPGTGTRQNFIDSDGDGVDDRRQTGPGQPKGGSGSSQIPEGLDQQLAAEAMGGENWGPQDQARYDALAAERGSSSSPPAEVGSWDAYMMSGNQDIQQWWNDASKEGIHKGEGEYQAGHEDRRDRNTDSWEESWVGQMNERYGTNNTDIGQFTKEQFAEYHYDTWGKNEGRPRMAGDAVSTPAPENSIDTQYGLTATFDNSSTNIDNSDNSVDNTDNSQTGIIDSTIDNGGVGVAGDDNAAVGGNNDVSNMFNRETDISTDISTGGGNFSNFGNIGSDLSVNLNYNDMFNASAGSGATGYDPGRSAYNANANAMSAIALNNNQNERNSGQFMNTYMNALQMSGLAPQNNAQ